MEDMTSVPDPAPVTMADRIVPFCKVQDSLFMLTRNFDRWSQLAGVFGKVLELDRPIYITAARRGGDSNVIRIGPGDLARPGVERILAINVQLFRMTAC